MVSSSGTLARRRSTGGTSASLLRKMAVYGLPAAIMVIWAGYVSVSGQWDRVSGHWQATLTMIFGSFVAGSTPQGGGAVAFPVFTKVLEVPPPVARSFSLSSRLSAW